MLIWLHARDSTQSSLHSSFCTHFSSPLISFAIVRAAHSVDIQYVSLVKSSHSVCQIPLMLQISVLLCFPPFHHGVMLRAISVQGREKVFMTYLLMEVSLPPSVSDTLIHISGDQQVISQPAGLPGVIPVQFTDKSDTAGQEVLFYLGSVLACSICFIQRGDENQHCGLCSAAKKKKSCSIKLTWIFSHSPSGTC